VVPELGDGTSERTRTFLISGVKVVSQFKVVDWVRGESERYARVDQLEVFEGLVTPREIRESYSWEDVRDCHLRFDWPPGVERVAVKGVAACISSGQTLHLASPSMGLCQLLGNKYQILASNVLD
jgi:hypothetical protein